MATQKITVETTVNKDVNTSWDYWTLPEHITNWNFASDEWHSPRATNDIKTGGKFNYRMEAKDGSAGFDFEGVYDEVNTHKNISYSLGDDRKVKIIFESVEGGTKIIQSFDTEDVHAAEYQKAGWQAIMDNYKKYVESK